MYRTELLVSLLPLNRRENASGVTSKIRKEEICSVLTVT